LLNVSKFVLSFGDVDTEGPVDDVVTDSVDRSMLAKLDGVIAESTSAFDAYDYARALERTESFFWWFCDNYVELVKSRAYESMGPEAAASARRGLREALSSLQRLFAPFLPFATEEAWSWWHDTRIHVSAWPAPTSLAGDPRLIDAPIEVLTLVRRAKSEAKVSQRAGVDLVAISAPPEVHDHLEAGRADLAAAGTIAEISVVTSDDGTLTCDVTIAPATTA
jgi:valyl-tRNA synthetase